MELELLCRKMDLVVLWVSLLESARLWVCMDKVNCTRRVYCQCNLLFFFRLSSLFHHRNLPLPPIQGPFYLHTYTVLPQNHKSGPLRRPKSF